RRRHTRSDRDWSSDVCSSDLRRCSIVTVCGDIASAAPAISSDTQMNARIGRRSMTLYLDLDDLPDPDESDRLHHDRDGDHHSAHRLGDEHLDMLWTDERERHGERRRQRQEHEAGKPAVCRMRAHLTLDLETLTDDVSEVVENFRQVATALTLNGN